MEDNFNDQDQGPQYNNVPRYGAGPQDNNGWQYGQGNQYNNGTQNGAGPQMNAGPQYNNTQVPPVGSPMYNESLKRDPHYMTMKDWIITTLIMCIPLVNLIMFFVWGFGTPEEPKFQSRKTWCQAALIMTAIMFVVYFVIIMILLVTLAASGGMMNY
ncbi:MAG: hypothetical protein VZR00_05015 [Lachnospiraceae bacterium]|nr:hypothetical protein [Lachnospiraceae bacterium]MEE3461237.1 hypothetical protein [Lachnospiraceae bacterium]